MCIRDRGLDVGFCVGKGPLTRTDIEFGHAILLVSKIVPGSRSTNPEISSTPELSTIRIQGFEFYVVNTSQLDWRKNMGETDKISDCCLTSLRSP